jgi:hypothetical protein
MKVSINAFWSRVWNGHTRSGLELNQPYRPLIRSGVYGVFVAGFFLCALAWLARLASWIPELAGVMIAVGFLAWLLGICLIFIGIGGALVSALLFNIQRVPSALPGEDAL